MFSPLLNVPKMDALIITLLVMAPILAIFCFSLGCCAGVYYISRKHLENYDQKNHYADEPKIHPPPPPQYHPIQNRLPTKPLKQVRDTPQYVQYTNPPVSRRTTSTITPVPPAPSTPSLPPKRPAKPKKVKNTASNYESSTSMNNGYDMYGQTMRDEDEGSMNLG